MDGARRVDQAPVAVIEAYPEEGVNPRSVLRDRVRLGVVLAALVALFAPTIAWLFDRWTMSVWHHAHGLMIPPLVAYFVTLELRPLRHLPRTSSAWGFAILAPALALHALDAGMHTELLSAFALVLAMPGLSLLFLGPARTRAILVPLAFLLFMLPIPLSVTEPIHFGLRQIASVASASLVEAIGIPVYREGTTLHLPSTTLLIGDACSGFSTLYAAAAVATLLAYTAASRWRACLTLIAAAPLAIGSNVLRVMLLALLVHWYGSDVLGTWMHPASGMLTFVLALPPLFWIGSGPAVEQRA